MKQKNKDRTVSQPWLVLLLVMLMVGLQGPVLASPALVPAGDSFPETGFFRQEVPVKVLTEEGGALVVGQGLFQDERYYVPLRSVAEALGYEVNWNALQSQIDIVALPFFSSLQVGHNQYSKYRMAPFSLSSAPIMLEGTTYVPMEFVGAVLGYAVGVEDQAIHVYPEESMEKEGYLIDMVQRNETTVLVLAPSREDTELVDTLTVLLHPEHSVVQLNTLQVGDRIRVQHSLVMTLSLPPQTQGWLVYR